MNIRFTMTFVLLLLISPLFGCDRDAAQGLENQIEFIDRTRTTEAALWIRQIAQAAGTYYSREYIEATGNILEPQFPASVGRTPIEVPCGVPTLPNGTEWEQSTWQALMFRPTDYHYYSYQFDSSGVGPSASFTVYAFGDLDCDGVLSTFSMIGQVDPQLHVQISDRAARNNLE